MLQCLAVSCSAFQCVAVCCSVLQCVAVCCMSTGWRRFMGFLKFQIRHHMTLGHPVPVAPNPTQKLRKVSLPLNLPAKVIIELTFEHICFKTQGVGTCVYGDKCTFAHSQVACVVVCVAAVCCSVCCSARCSVCCSVFAAVCMLQWSPLR